MKPTAMVNKMVERSSWANRDDLLDALGSTCEAKHQT